MESARFRPITLAAIVVIAGWLVAMMGIFWARNSRVTSEKVRTYISSVDFKLLRGQQRAKAIHELAGMINALPLDEREEMWLKKEWEGWFAQMNESEQSDFVEATMPLGIKQMLSAFERMSETNRQRTIDSALKRLRDAHELPMAEALSGGTRTPRTNETMIVTPELEHRMRVIGLNAIYSESSARTKAEVAPLLEEIQQLMKNGAVLH